MKEIIREVVAALDRGTPLVFCGIVESSGSAPRTSGARMLVLPDGSIRGSVGGGALEGRCMEQAARMLTDGTDHAFLNFDLTAANAADAGMVCGGGVRVLLQTVASEQAGLFRTVQTALARGERAALLTLMAGEADPVLAVWTAGGGASGMELTENLSAELVRKMGRTRQSFTLEDGGWKLFVEPVVCPGVVHVVGAGHVALATAKVASFVGFELVVMDDRAEFANTERYPEAREVRVLENFDSCLGELGPDDYVIIVTRGHLHDRDVLAQALRTQAGYIGMIGSKPKRLAVYKSLLENGFTQADLDRVYSPIGLTIGADTPEEIAVSIVGELIKVRAGLDT